MPNSLTNSAIPHAQALLRIVSGFLLSLHGATIIFGLFNAPKPATFLTLIWFAGILQLIGGPLLIFGLFTRVTAFILSGHLAFAYFLAHAPKGFWPNLNGGELAALYSFVFLFLAFAGPGASSLDGLLAKIKQRRLEVTSKSNAKSWAQAS
jgi:putative oxidoreductase